MTTKIRPEPTIPDHEVYRKIGGGSYGEVWLAQGVTGALRAVKVVWHDDFDDERGFEREFEGIKKYEPVSRDHAGLVKILHVGRGESDGEAFYYHVMELGDDVVTGREINPVEYEARTLRSDMLAAEKKPLDLDFCIEAGRELAEGLEHLHQDGLAHRDVKPANVIFVDGKAKLADIGLVAARDQRTFVGTEGFVPPEGPGSAQADVYSLGKVLYEMATGMDRLDFPELPDEVPQGKDLKRWRRLNGVICDVCEPRISKRTIKTAGELATELERLQSGRRRSVRLTRSAVMTVMAAVAMVLVAWQLPNITSALSSKPTVIPVQVPAEVPEVYVTVTSFPLGAEVYDAEGNYLADTPLVPRKFPLGAKLEYAFMLDGFQPKIITATVTGEVNDDGTLASLIIAPELDIYAPPVDGDPWVDVLGASYQGVDNYHISNYYVGAGHWRKFKEEVKDAEGLMAKVSENGVESAVVFCHEEEAQRYSDWLEEKSRDGYLTVDHEMEPRMDRDTTFQGLRQEVIDSGGRPFRMVVRRIPYAHVMITSTPSGADVYIDGQWRGVTPLLGDPAGAGVKVNPAAGILIVEREGYERERRELTLAGDEVWDEPMHFNLQQSAGVVFDREWSNSLGMKMVPVNDGLMASIWETRVKDYQAYLTGGKVALRKRIPVFEQTGDHPVVFVSPNDARKFCAWLTEVEQREGLIAKHHHYRLPTDQEWSEMVGLPREPGFWPIERGDPPANVYPWGAWPPGEGDGNYSDLTAVREGAQPVTKSIVGYDDGYAYTAPVGQTTPNDLGIYDLGGNVSEWVEDSYAAGQQYSVARGGGWSSYQSQNLDSSFRNAVNEKTGVSDNIYGFRVVLAKDALVLEGEEGEIESEEYTD